MKRKIKNNSKNKKNRGGARKKKITYSSQLPKSEPMHLMDSQALTISPQGQITIPKPWREMLGFKPGVKILAWLKETGDDVKLTLAAEPKNWVDEMAGISTGVWGSTEEIDDYVKKIRSEWDREWDK